MKATPSDETRSLLATKLHGFRFSLKALLVLVAVLCALLAAIRILWPAWREHRAARVILRSLNAGNWYLCNQRIESFKASGRGNDAIPGLVKSVSNVQHDMARQFAIITLGSFGPEAKQAVPTLQWALREDSQLINRVQAAAALWKINSQSDESIPVLVEALADPVHNVRITAVKVLAAMAPEVDAALDALTMALQQHENSDVRVTICGVLAQMRPKADGAVPALTKALDDESEHVRKAARWALEKIDRNVESVNLGRSPSAPSAIEVP